MLRAFTFLLLGTLSLGLCAQCPGDADGDGINDALEQGLAERFAPQWRFNKWQSGDGSSQNNNEKNFPSSVEGWFAQAEGLGNGVVLKKYSTYFSFPVGEETDAIGDIDELDQMEFDDNMLVSDSAIPHTGYIYPNGVKVVMKMDGFPEDMMGNPDAFPTYFHCYVDPSNANRLKMSFLLFLPYDEKATPLDKGDHRGDWKGVSLVFSGIDDPCDPNAFSDAVLESVWYGGHGQKRYIEPDNVNYYHTGDHPCVYVSRGAHVCFPRPGEWHNYDVGGTWGWAGISWLIGTDSYDDMFRGDGLVVQSGIPGYPLVNLGESGRDNLGGDVPLVGWLDFAGQWGPDGDPDGDSSSPPGPPGKGEWLGSLSNAFEWDYLVDHGDTYLSDFQPVNTSISGGWHVDSSSPVLILWDERDYSGEPWLVTGPAEYPDITTLVDVGSVSEFFSDSFSVLFAGKLRLRLYTGYNFTGSSITITKSKRVVNGDYLSMKIEMLNGDLSCDVVVDDGASGLEDGTFAAPYNTLTEGVNAANNGATICILPGQYHLPNGIHQVMKIRKYGTGTVYVED